MMKHYDYADELDIKDLSELKPKENKVEETEVIEEKPINSFDKAILDCHFKNEEDLNNYLTVLNNYSEVSKRIKKSKTVKERDNYLLKMAEYCDQLYRNSLSIEDKIELYNKGRVDLIPFDGLGLDRHGGKLLPTEKEVEIGIYDSRELLYFPEYTCGVYRFWTTDKLFNYIGMSQYVEFSIHAVFSRWRSEHTKKDIKRKRIGRVMPSVEWLVYNHPELVRFEIIEAVPYSILPYAVEVNRIKYNATWQDDFYSRINFTPEKYYSGLYSK